MCALPDSYKYQIHGVHRTGGQRHKDWMIYCRQSCEVLLKMRKICKCSANVKFMRGVLSRKFAKGQKKKKFCK